MKPLPYSIFTGILILLGLMAAVAIQSNNPVVKLVGVTLFLIALERKLNG